MPESWRLGIDVGGTFTDLVASGPAGAMLSAKIPSTADQSNGVMEAIAEAASQRGLRLEGFLSDVDMIVHGTTVATNSLLEMRGAKVGLITTAGFRDELEFRRSFKESTFNPRLQPPPAICPRRYRIGVPERVDASGIVQMPLDEAAVRAALRFFRAEAIDALAVCFLFSFLNPAHERRIAELAAEELPGAFVSLSSEVLPEIREFERVSTTVVNAFVGPAIASYLTRLEQKLRARGFAGELMIMQSNGGVLGVGETARSAVNTLLSGPAGGVTAAAFVGEKAGYQDLITVDMGGTSYDISVIERLRPQVTTTHWIGRYRIAKPVLDIHTVGAGGGSVAWIDNGGALRVGPESAGATPGPACYGRGGSRPTVTDADLILGFLDADRFLGGKMSLSIDRARQAVQEHVAQPLGIGLIEAALAINEIVNHNMAQATHFVTTKRGHDPGGFALVAVGGAGAIHAGHQAQLLGIETIIVPSLASVFCALGDVVAPLQVNEARTLIAGLDRVDLMVLNELFAELERRARARLADTKSHGRLEVRRFLDLRYAGEVHEVTVPLKSRTLRVTALNIDTIAQDFHEIHEKLFAHSDPRQAIEIQTVRIELVGVREPPEWAPADFAGEDPSAAKNGVRDVYFDVSPTAVPVYDGRLLRPGNFIPGPAILEQWGTNIILRRSQEALIDAFGNCVIEVARISAAATP